MKNRKTKESGLELRIDVNPENRYKHFVQNSNDASDNTLIMNYTIHWQVRAIFIVFFSTMSYMTFNFVDLNNITIMDACIFTIGSLIWLYPLKIILDPTKKRFILDRKNGKITFPERFPLSCFGKTVTIPFSDVKLGCGSRNTAVILYPNGQNRTAGWNVTDTLAFFVWYMDKNRPLPPGELFDPYRQKDFERRKSEGFPPPLYPSSIPTPEATPEQQKEREKYWKG